MVSRAKQLFVGKGKFGKKNTSSGPNIRSELKNSNQIMKVFNYINRVRKLKKILNLKIWKKVKEEKLRAIKE